jgi:tight adherence protein C
MFIILLAGLGCLALAGLQFTRTWFAADRDRLAAIQSVRAATGAGAPETIARKALLLPHLLKLAARLHQRLWRRESTYDIDVKLLRAGVSRRITAEMFMGGRVLVTIGGMVGGFVAAHGAGRILLPLCFGAAGIILPGFILSKAATRRSERIDADLPHFADQLAIAIEAGMSFDSSVSYLADASSGPLAEEMKRVLTELRVGESRRSAMRNFAQRVGSEETRAFANAILASDQLGSPISGILRSQASDIRHRRQMHAEERAQKTPVKMLFPMVIFILPVMFLIILGPAFLGSHGVL